MTQPDHESGLDPIVAPSWHDGSAVGVLIGRGLGRRAGHPSWVVPPQTPAGVSVAFVRGVADGVSVAVRAEGDLRVPLPVTVRVCDRSDRPAGA